MTQKLDLDALERSTQDGNGGTKSVMWFDGYVLRQLIARIRELESDNLELCGIAQAADAHRRALESASQAGGGVMSDELKPTACPFCGHDNVDTFYEGSSDWYVMCGTCVADGPSEGSKRRAIAAWNRRPTPEQSGEAQERCDVGHAHFTPFYLLANARRIASREYSQKPNWVLAMNLFAVGSNTAYRVCREAGIDPDGLTAIKIIDAAMGGAS